MSNRKIIFVTGLSGAGISNALKALEDCGYEVFDNCPLTYLERIINERGYEDKSMAFGLDSRTRAFSPDRVIKLAQENDAKLLFLNATNDCLQARFSETRRVHPLARDRAVVDGIIYEREWLKPLYENNDRLIDTTDLSVHDLKKILETDFGLNASGQRLSVTIMSFGFKKGVPREIDMLLDVRFLKNPHWEPSLRALTGQNKDVQAYIETDENFKIFYQKISKDIEWLLPRYAHEGKSYFTIAFGCTGGKHRSVYLTEKIAHMVKDLGYPVTIRHRDMPKT